MDPLTIIGLLASITNLIHASRSTLRVVNDFRDGDKSIQGLAEDIAVFTEALSGFDRVLRSRHTTHHIAEDVIKAMIEGSLKTLQDLERRLLQLSAFHTPTMRRMKWVQSSSAIKKLRERLKEQNAMLQTFLSITHAEAFITVISQYPSLCPADEEMGIRVHPPENTSFLQVLPDVRRPRRLSNASSIATIESMAATSVSSTDLTLYSSASSSGTSACSRLASEDTESEITLVSIPTRTKEPLEYQTLGDAQRVRRACHYKCYCKCHDGSATGPRRSLGKFKNTRLSCTDPTCLSHATIEEKYKSHSKSFFGALSRAMSSHNIKVRYNINTYRMVPESCDAFRFVKHGNLDKLKACIQSGDATIWDTAPDGWSLLHTAAYHRQLPIVKYLVDLGVDTKSGDVGSRNPADFAVLKSLGQDATQVERDVVRLFSQQDDILLDFEFTPLHIAVLGLYPANDHERPSLETLISLVDDANNASVNTKWAEWKLRLKNRSPLLGDIIEYFRSSAYESTPGTKIIYNLIDQKDKKFHWSPLHWATFSGQCEKIKVLVQHGADPLLLSNLNANILHTAAESKLNHGLSTVLGIWRRCSDQLNINQINVWGETPLHVASWCSPACVELLLEAGANPNIQQEDGLVPLHHVGLCEQGPDRREMVSLLCNTASRDHINVQDFEGRPPILEFLDDPECIETLLSNGARLDLVDSAGKNIFHYVCLQGEFRSLRILLDHSTKTDKNSLAAETDHSGNTPLMTALTNAHINCSMELLELENVGNIISKDGWAAVHYAAKIGDVDLLEAVFKHSSFMANMKTLDGKGVDTVAMEAGTWHGQVKELIRRYNFFGEPR
jgi:ankyrin repeat protein